MSESGPSHFLYMDTSDHLVVGLLDSNYNWCEFVELEGTRNSGRIHGIIHEILAKHKLAPQNLAMIIQNAGPGSYTGMRVSEGISQIFSWQGVPVCSFLHFEVPQFLGVKQGQWLAKAFKGEFFFHSWNENDKTTELLNLELAQEKVSKTPTYCHFRSSLEKDFEKSSFNFLETGSLIYKQATQLFPLISKRGSRLSPYYFRTVDQEFKISK